MNILFLGNSFTFYNEMPEMFLNTAKENGKDVNVYSVTKGGHKLCEYLHLDDVYRKQFLNAVEKRKYDYIFIQDQSFEPIKFPERFLKSVRELTEFLKDKTEKIVLYETWGYDKRCEKMKENGWQDEKMSKDLSAAYKRAAEDNKLMLSPVGENFLKVYKNTKINLYAADFRHPSYEGSVLAMLTHYKTVFGELPEKTSNITLTDDTLHTLKSAVE